jgi:hypothetical protein
MPFFKTNKNIFIDNQYDELYHANNYDSDKVIYPPGGPDDPKAKWDYARPMTVEDVDIWEEIYWQGGGLGLYAAWLPYAEFYMITPHGLYWQKELTNIGIELFYGPGSADKALKRARELGIPVPVSQVWVDQEDLWLYNPQLEDVKKIILP